MNIAEDYISFEIANLLKEKGFDISCREHYYQDGELSPYATEYNNWNDKNEDYFSCPSISLVMKWLREVYNIEVVINVCKYGEEHKTMYEWTPVIIKEERLDYPISQPDGSVSGGFEDSYERAADVAIRFCLEFLI